MKNLFKPLFATSLLVVSVLSIAPSSAHEREPFNFRSSNIIIGNAYRTPRYMGYNRRARTRTILRRNRVNQRRITRSYRAERRAAFRAAFTDE